MKSKGEVHGRGGINNMVHRSVRLMVAGGNNSWERMSGSAMTASTRAGFCCWRRESAIRIIHILTPRLYYCIVLDSLSPKKNLLTGTKVSGS